MKADMPFTRITKVMRYSNAYYLFLMLLVFSLMYWHAAWNKPFHVDEFYSWVYSYRCTFSEIMMMKDAGIGHPPLYHLLQKVVQTLCTDYHFLQVRLVNYIAAIFYIVSLAVIIYRSRKSYLLCLGVCISATVFELFLFSRMYGVLSLMALWAYILAEKYINTENNKYILLLLLVVVAGFFSDYNFVLVVPCVVISLLWRARHGGKIIVSCFVLAAVLLISASLYRIVHSGVQTVWGAMRFTASDTARALLETAYLILNFSFKELIALSCVILVCTGLSSVFKKNETERSVKSEGTIFTMLHRLKVLIKDEEHSVRTLLSLIGAYLILLSINPLFSIFRRDLIDTRFLFLIFPLIILLLTKHLPMKFLNVLSVIWICSGILFMLSNRVQNYYPPSTISGHIDCVYFNEFSYSTQYLKIDHKTGAAPEFIDPLFNSFCGVCTMGRVLNIDDRRDMIAVVGDENFHEAGIMPERYVLVGKYLFMSKLDELLFRYLTPISGSRFGMFIYENSGYRD